MTWKIVVLFLSFVSCNDSNKNTGIEDDSFVTQIIDSSSSEKIDTIISPDTMNQNEEMELIFCGLPSLDYIMGKFDPAINDCFERIPGSMADKTALYLRKEVLKAFIEMHHAAKLDGIDLIIISATRNFDYQKGIWERKWSGQTKLEGSIDARSIENKKERAMKIMRYSSMPGSSRHHWGTDIDLNELNNGWFEEGKGKKVYEWLQTKGKTFGFYQVYTSKDPGGRTGYEEEKWHYTYKPISAKLTQVAKEHLTDDLLVGFNGAKEATAIGVVEKYILGINDECWK